MLLRQKKAVQFYWTYRLDCSPSLDPWLQALAHQSVTCFQNSLCIFYRYLCDGNRRNSYENDYGNDNDNDNNRRNSYENDYGNDNDNDNNSDADDVDDDNNDNDGEDDDDYNDDE